MIVGREQVLGEVERRLDDSRLVTITGPGGIGKTTLARAVADRHGPDRYPLGNFWVDLTLVDDERDVGSALAAQLGYGSFRALIDSPTDEPALVVVDNCEHVLDAAADAIDALLAACRSPTVVATSRSPLGVAGESLVVLPPLGLPTSGLDERTAPAVEFFLQRANESGATIPESEIAAVVGLCRVLDGVPLALELAAARSRVLTPTELLERLGDIDTLRRPRSRGPARHRSLRDTIAWSYELLDEVDRRFFDRLAVLGGPFTTEDAHAVAGEGDVATTIDRLDRLVSDSLLTTTSVAGVTHHRQLEMVRGFARDRLVASGDWDATWQRFVGCVTDRSVRLVTESAAGWDRSSLATLVSRVEQHLAVLRWCLDFDERPDRSFVLVATLWGVIHQGRVDEIAPVAERAIQRWDDPTLPGWADASATAATCHYMKGRPAEAIRLAERGLVAADAAHYAPCTLRRVIAHSQVAIGDLAGAVETLSVAIGMAADRVPAFLMEMTVSRAELLATLAEGTPAVVHVLDEQRAVVREVAASAARRGSAVNEIWARSVEAELVARADPAAGRILAEEALTAAGAALYPAAESVNLHTLGVIALDIGDVPAAAVLAHRLIDGVVARGADYELRNGLRLAAVVLERAGDPAWRPLGATAGALPSVSLFSVPGHERHALPSLAGHDVVDVRTAVQLARARLDAVATAGALAPMASVPDDPPHQTGPANTWLREQDVWTITYDGATIRTRSSKGLTDIARLLASPDTDVHCVELAGAVVEHGDGAALIDTRARREYEQRIRDLQTEVDEAEAAADMHRAERAHVEMDTLVDHLTAALGLGGRARRHADSAERARSAVTQRIRSTIRRLRAVHPSLAAHLEASVQTGMYCRYRPERPTAWVTARPRGPAC